MKARITKKKQVERVIVTLVFSHHQISCFSTVFTHQLKAKLMEFRAADSLAYSDQ